MRARAWISFCDITVVMGRNRSMIDRTWETLHSAIETQVGKVTGGERGRRILEKVRREVAELKGERRPKGRFKAAIASVEETQTELEQCQREAADIEGDVARLSSSGTRARIRVARRTFLSPCAVSATTSMSFRSR